MKDEIINHQKEQSIFSNVSYEDYEIWVENDCTKEERENCKAGTCLPQRCYMIEKWRKK